MAACKDLPGSAVDTVLFTLRLVGYEAKQGPGRFLKALESPQVVSELEKALLKVANDNLAKQRKGEREGAKQAAAALGKAAGGAVLAKAPGEMLAEIKKSSRYLRVEQSIKDLQCAFQRSPTGVWIDEHSALLIIAVAGVVVGGATAMYVTRSGDTPADWMTKLADSQLKQIQLGELKLGVSDVKFVPSKRLLGAKLNLERGKLKSVRTKLSLKVVTEGSNLKSIGLTSQMLVPLAPGFTGEFKGGFGTEGYELLLGISGRREGLTLDVAAQVKKDPEKFSFGGKAGVKYTTRLDGSPIEVKADASIDRGWKLDLPERRAETEIAFSVSAAWRF